VEVGGSKSVLWSTYVQIFYVFGSLSAFPRRCEESHYKAVLSQGIIYLRVRGRSPWGQPKQLCRHLRSEGIVAFQKSAMSLARSNPDGQYFRQCGNWIMDTFARDGFELDMGNKLFATFRKAGLPVPQMIVAGRVEGGPDSPVYDCLATILRSLLPMAERFGVATVAEIETLAERLRHEAVQHNASITPPPLIGAWTRTPPSPSNT
jgi:hypothetical protein